MREKFFRNFRGFAGAKLGVVLLSKFLQGGGKVKVVATAKVGKS